MPQICRNDHKISNDFGAYVLSTNQQALNSCGRFDGSPARKPQELWPHASPLGCPGLGRA
jgi:hypothetical protein